MMNDNLVRAVDCRESLFGLVKSLGTQVVIETSAACENPSKKKSNKRKATET